MQSMTLPASLAYDVADGLRFVLNVKVPTKYRGPVAIRAARQVLGMTQAEAFAAFPGVGCIVATADIVSSFSLRGRSIDDVRELRRAGLRLPMVTKSAETKGPSVVVLAMVRRLDEPVRLDIADHRSRGAGKFLVPIPSAFLESNVDELAF